MRRSVRVALIVLAWLVILTPKHKFAVAYDYQNICNWPRSLTAQIAPESNVRNHAILAPKDMVFVDWTAPPHQPAVDRGQRLQAARARVSPTAETL